MGFKLPDNFNAPYRALNITDFWRRWHITLSTWLRDYLFLRLSLRFRSWGTAGIALALMITFVICGFWHDAKVTFIIWGALQGLAMVWDIYTEKFRKRLRKRINKNVYTFLSWFITFNLIALFWIFFRAENLSAAFSTINKVFSDVDWNFFGPFMRVRYLFVVILIISFASHFIPQKIHQTIQERFINMPFWLKAIILVVVIQLILQFQSATVQPFIYNQF